MSKEKKCKQCANPNLKGLHTCGKRNKKKKPSLIKRLREPVDKGSNVISYHNTISNQGLRLMSNKLDAIGEALALLMMDRKHEEFVAERVAYHRGRTDGIAEARQRPGDGDMGG